MTTATTDDVFTPPSLLDSVLLLALVFGAAAAVTLGYTKPTAVPLVPGGGTPALRVKATPQSAFAPLHLNVEVRQQFEQVAGRQVCLRVAGPEDTVSCWADERPAALVVRTFTLRSVGDYEVFAVVTDRSGHTTQESNRVVVQVAGNE